MHRKPPLKTKTSDINLVKKLTSHPADQFRQLDINQFDLNFTQHFEQLQHIDDTVTPLIYCAHFGLKQICRILLQNKNIDIDQETKNNKQTALITACANGNYEIVRLLLLAGAEVNKPNCLNLNALSTILFRLVEEQYSFENRKICFLIAQLLIDNGADPNWIIDKIKGFSLLHYFCCSKVKMSKNHKLINYEIIKFLLKNGANPFQKSLKDKDAFDMIETHCNKEQILELLKQCATEKKVSEEKLKEDRVDDKKKKSLTEEFLKIQIKNCVPKAEQEKKALVEEQED